MTTNKKQLAHYKNRKRHLYYDACCICEHSEHAAGIVDRYYCTLLREVVAKYGVCDNYLDMAKPMPSLEEYIKIVEVANELP